MNRAPLGPFHLAIPVDDLEAARSFYGGVLGCAEGRSAPQWIDFDFFGHQLVCHLAPAAHSADGSLRNAVDGHGVPVPHFGMVLDPAAFEKTRERLTAAAIPFDVEPHVRFRGQPGEQATMFVRDPAGNAVEFKALADPDQLFAR
ncbi:VOC family protein [Elongatibacter sediminis]|uniref:VOC family protein n=1 Tax=Elongatibacter sediminis TaxID=3119006 RepID=A0AAW9RAX3_9GAMM